MKKTMIFALCTAMALSLAACDNSSTQNSSSSVPSSSSSVSPSSSSAPSSSSVEVPNPFVEYQTLDEATKEAGFEIVVPDSIEGTSKRTIRAMKDELIEVIYSGDEGSGKIRIRKGNGSEDISGDYSTYAQSNTITVGNLQVTMKGNGDQVQLATWTDGDFAYAISSSDALSSDAMSQLVAKVQ